MGVSDMMHKKLVAWERKTSAPKQNAEENADRYLIALIYSMSAEFAENPKIYIDGENVIWAHYENSSYVCNSFFDEFGISVAIVSQKYPICIYGSASGCESAQILAKIENKKTLLFQKLDISGKDFEQITDLCIKIETSDSERQKELYDILCNVDYRKSFIVVKRTQYTKKVFVDFPQASENTFYRFIPVDETVDYTQAICSLSLEQKKKLWTILIVDKVSTVEFDYLLDIVNHKDGSSLYPLFSWELALRLVLSETNTKISYDGDEFKITDNQGNRVRYDYVGGTSAQKLFLKILFPVPTSSDAKIR